VLKRGEEWVCGSYLPRCGICRDGAAGLIRRLQRTSLQAPAGWWTHPHLRVVPGVGREAGGVWVWVAHGALVVGLGRAGGHPEGGRQMDEDRLVFKRGYFGCEWVNVET
jgi:hypothetical protein